MPAGERENLTAALAVHAGMIEAKAAFRRMEKGHPDAVHAHVVLESAASCEHTATSAPAARLACRIVPAGERWREFAAPLSRDGNKKPGSRCRLRAQFDVSHFANYAIVGHAARIKNAIA
jgi:hypothetical protein